MPKAARMTKIGQTDAVPLSVKASSATAQSASIAEADRHDGAPAVAVGDGAGDEHEQQRRQELREADEAEIERVARQVVDLPADRHRLDLHGEARRPAATASRCMKALFWNAAQRRARRNLGRDVIAAWESRRGLAAARRVARSLRRGSPARQPARARERLAGGASPRRSCSSRPCRRIATSGPTADCR